MEMIIGGAYQGKSSYAEKQFPDVKWKCGAELTEEELLEAEGGSWVSSVHKKVPEIR